MIPSSRAAQAVALLTAGAVHATLALAMMQGPPPQVEGAPGGVDLRLGTSFADLAVGAAPGPAGVTAPRPDPTRAALRPPDTGARDRPRPAPPEPVVARSEPPPDAARAEAVHESHVSATAPTRGVTGGAAAPVGPEGHDGTVGLVAPRPVAAETAPAPARSAPREAATASLPRSGRAIAPGTPSRAALPGDAAALSARMARQAVEIDRSARPRARPPDLRSAQAHAAGPTAQGQATTRQARPPAPAGNADRTARAGSTEGRESGTARSAGSGAAATAGTAAASNYPGLVMRCVARAGRPRVDGRGTARVSFTIAESGRIGSVALAAGSGNAALDRAAVTLIRRAGRCPPPPPGAQRSFSIAVEAR